MRYAVTFERWNPAMQRLERDVVVVEADTGDGAVSRARIAAMETGIQAARVVGVEPAPPEPELPEPAVEAPQDEYAALLREAEAAGLDVDRRWGVARLRAVVEAAR